MAGGGQKRGPIQGEDDGTLHQTWDFGPRRRRAGGIDDARPRHGFGGDSDNWLFNIEELAQAFKAPPAALRKSLENANLKPPYYGALITGALAHTQGGLKVDVHARVLDTRGRPIPNLYAGGGSAAGISGDGADGYLSGNGLLSALGLGLIAGEHAANAILSERALRQ